MITASGELDISRKSCAHCGAALPKWYKKYCSAECRRRAANERARKTGLSRVELLAKADCRQEHHCLRCGKLFHPKRAGRHTFCSRECSFAKLSEDRQRRLQKKRRARIRELRRRCTLCGNKFLANNSSQSLCSDRCRSIRDRISYLRKSPYGMFPAVMTACRECGIDFELKRTGRGVLTRSLCSEPCRQRRRSRLRRKYRRLHGRRSKHRQRARHHGVSYESFSVKSIFERDGWRCQICGTRTPKRLRGSFSENAPELDHRIPMALGGGHIGANVQFACRKCNLEKGDRVVVGQLQLFP